MLDPNGTPKHEIIHHVNSLELRLSTLEKRLAILEKPVVESKKKPTVKATA